MKKLLIITMLLLTTACTTTRPADHSYLWIDEVSKPDPTRPFIWNVSQLKQR